ncbi:hypothetical protein CYMTET_18915, partial [Cymbomonas tetramitiformis]
IRMMIPGAKVVHILRNPLDTCWSNFKQPLEGGLAMFASNLTNCAEYYRIHKDIMLHWSKLLPKSSILELHYEDLVQNQLEKTTELLEFIGVPWEDEVMSFHRTPGSVVTASVAQARPARPRLAPELGSWTSILAVMRTADLLQRTDEAHYQRLDLEWLAVKSVKRITNLK